MNDRGVAALVARIGDDPLRRDGVQLRARTCKGPPATRNAVAGATITFQATLGDRKNEGSSWSQRRQRHRNPMQSRCARDSAGAQPAGNQSSDNQDVAEPNKRQNRQVGKMLLSPGNAACFSLFRRISDGDMDRRFPVHVTALVGSNLMPKSWRRDRSHCECGHRQPQ
jgi:hypothetical protein